VAWWSASLLRRSHAGIQLVEHTEADHGGTVFDHACRLGRALSASAATRRIVCRSGAWLKVKNRKHPAMSREWEDRFS